jgi:DNA-directed RNA polymerase specialized sigma24 family protein
MKMEIRSGRAARDGIRKIPRQMNQDAFDRALVKLSARLPAYFRRRVSDATVVEDLTQETLLKAFRGRGALREAARIEAWVCLPRPRTRFAYFTRTTCGRRKRKADFAAAPFSFR